MRPLFLVSYGAPEKVLRRRASSERAVEMCEVGHMLRDASAQVNLLSALEGHALEDTILNLPQDVFGSQVPAESPRLPPEALLLLATRPPLNEDPLDRKRIQTSGTELERQIFKRLGCFLRFCSKGEVWLSDGIAGLPDVALDHVYCKFRQYGIPLLAKCGARDDQAKRPKGGNGRTTLGYLIFVPSILTDAPGPGLLNCFGLSGTATLVWSLLLKAASHRGDERLTLSRIVASGRARLIVAEIDLPKPGAFPGTLNGLVEGVRPRILIDVELDSPGVPPADPGSPSLQPGAAGGVQGPALPSSSGTGNGAPAPRASKRGTVRP